MTYLKIGGVPEHFNLPWKIALDDPESGENQFVATWKEYPKGTGDMNRALREREIDMAVILTEGIVRDIVHGNPSKIIQVYVKSPLLWGIHVAAHSEFSTVEDLKGTRAAISRYGSGSHLMAYVNAENLGWDLNTDLDFEVIDDLQGALMGLPKGEADYFMWEKFMTKPYVDKGIFRLIDEIPTPWPSFVIAVREDVLQEKKAVIVALLQTLNSVTDSFKGLPRIEDRLAEHFGHKPADVNQWLSLTEWTDKPMTAVTLDRVQEKLLQLGLIDHKLPAHQILHSL